MKLEVPVIVFTFQFMIMFIMKKSKKVAPITLKLLIIS